MNLPELLKNAGVVGAGGAGFPTYVKAASKVEFVLANGAECEPLIHKDYELMKLFPSEIVRGFSHLMQSASARKGYFGIKAKNVNAIEKIENEIRDTAIEMTLLGDFYPAGDEYELVYEATKRLIPAGGIPLQVGCIVNNVETMLNVCNAVEGKPLTHKFVCVAGAVRNPCTFFAPVGATFRELINAAGGATCPEFGFFIGGLMMGQLSFNLDDVVTKTTAGLIVLPLNHYQITRKNQPEKNWHRIGKSACDQCSYCTEFCPRYLLGYDVQPHKVMRSLGFTGGSEKLWNQYAELCCACGLCTLYSCPEDLFPKEACDKSKAEMRSDGFKYTQNKPVAVHPMKPGRRVPIKQLIARLKLTEYDVHTPYRDITISPNSLKIALKQHVGTKATAVVAKGEYVKFRQKIADVPNDALGAPLHAPMDGIVTEITEDYLLIAKN